MYLHNIGKIILHNIGKIILYIYSKMCITSSYVLIEKPHSSNYREATFQQLSIYREARFQQLSVIEKPDSSNPLLINSGILLLTEDENPRLGICTLCTSCVYNYIYCSSVLVNSVYCTLHTNLILAMQD